MLWLNVCFGVTFLTSRFSAVFEVAEQLLIDGGDGGRRINLKHFVTSAKLVAAAPPPAETARFPNGFHNPPKRRGVVSTLLQRSHFVKFTLRRTPAFDGRGAAAVFAILAAMTIAPRTMRGEAMLELFQMTWPQVTQKMPEFAEAGYDSLWLPNPAKGNGGSYSIGYDVFDPFDLGGTTQQGTVATRYGTQDQLLQMVQTAHRFGLRVYFDNVMNHRAATVPGYPGSGTPTNYYPGLIPEDFHLQTVSGGYQNWASCAIWPMNRAPTIGILATIMATPS